MRRLGTLTAIVAFVAAFTLVFATAPKVAHAGHVSCGDTLSADTTLDGNLACAGPGLIIDTDGITLNCDKKTVSGDGTDIGILLDGVEGVTVKKCKVDNFAINIKLLSSSGNLIKKNEVTGATSSGSGSITLIESDGNVLVKNEAKNNAGRGIAFSDSDGNLLVENEAKRNNFRGFDIISSDGNVLVENEAKENGSAGIVVSSSTGNILYRNEAKESSFEGFAIFSSGNFLLENEANDNTTFGIRDSGGNVYTDNECDGNGTADSLPAGLDPPGCI